jgi:hypothetical protein
MYQILRHFCEGGEIQPSRMIQVAVECETCGVRKEEGCSSVAGELGMISEA